MKITVFDIGTITNSDIDISKLNQYGETKIYDVTSPEDTISLIGDSDIVLSNKTKITGEIMRKCPHLKYIGIMATGYNNVDISTASELGITVTNIPGYSTESVASLTTAFILQFATNLIKYTDSTKKGDWLESKRFTYFPYPMFELSSKTVGIFGMGSIGQRVANVLSALGANVIYTSRTKKDVPYESVTKEELFSRSDIISLHAPLTDDTFEIVNSETIKNMKTGAYIVNTARGGLINEKDVKDALNSGKLGGYAADVLVNEPQVKECGLIGAENLYLTPHIAWASKETRQRLFDILLDNLGAYLSGTPKNTVNGK